MQSTFGEIFNCHRMTVLMILFGMISVMSCQWMVGDPDVGLAEGDSCRIRSGGPGVCKRIDTCEPYYEGLRKKTIQYSFLVRCSLIGFIEVICCPETSTGTPSPTSTIRTVTTRNENERPSQTACRRYSSLNPTGLTFHILDGTPAAPGDYPHMGGLIYQSGGGSDIDVRCGTSLISERYTLTAAHCANDDIAQPIMVRFGVVILTASEDGIEPLDVEIESIALHPDYRAQFRYHDVAVIKLRKDVEFTTYIRPACLYSDLSDVDSNIPLAVIGWGVTNVQTRSRSGVLLVANLTSVPLDQCNRTHTENGVSRSYKNGLNDGQYCAYDIALQKDACQADSGGPLQLVQKQVSTIVGIVSFGLSCGSAIPSVYARVAFYLNWIESVVWP